jgi:hypothetical protein
LGCAVSRFFQRLLSDVPWLDSGFRRNDGVFFGALLVVFLIVEVRKFDERSWISAFAGMTGF